MIKANMLLDQAWEELLEHYDTHEELREFVHQVCELVLLQEGILSHDKLQMLTTEATTDWKAEFLLGPISSACEVIYRSVEKHDALEEIEE